jgi:hypothetical protein
LGREVQVGATRLAPARSRITRILHEPRLLAMLLAGGVAAAIVVFVIGFSGAYYTSSSSSPGSTIAAADLRISLSKSGELLDGTGLKPGATRAGQVTVTNLEHRARLTLGVSGLAESPTLADVIDATVTQTSPAVGDPLYSGPLRELQGRALGTLGGGEARTYRIEITWPASDNDASLQGATTSFVFEWIGLSEPDR